MEQLPGQQLMARGQWYSRGWKNAHSSVLKVLVRVGQAEHFGVLLVRW